MSAAYWSLPNCQKLGPWPFPLVLFAITIIAPDSFIICSLQVCYPMDPLLIANSFKAISQEGLIECSTYGICPKEKASHKVQKLGPGWASIKGLIVLILNALEFRNREKVVSWSPAAGSPGGGGLDLDPSTEGWGKWDVSVKMLTLL